MRMPAQIRKPRTARLGSFPAPVAGLIANRSLAFPGAGKLPPGAAVLRNWFPTASGIVLRRGSMTRVSTGSTKDIRALWSYVNASNERLFAATDDGIWDVTTSTAVSSGRTITSGDWIVTQFATAGGVFLVGVNGADDGWTYDGATFTTISLTGVLSKNLAYVWAYKQRLYFVEKNSLNVWYLPVDQIGGTVTKLPLGGVFAQGGSIVWGHTWSGDSSGDGGLSEQNVFVTSEGEVAVFQGLSPDDAATWGKVGIYRIGRPLGKRAFIRAGGDLLIATSVGFVSLAEAARRDLAALGAAAVSYPIEDAWRAAVGTYGTDGWSCETWAEGTMILVAPPPGIKSPVVYVANSNTGAWCEFTGWRATALRAWQGRIFFGASAGVVKEAWVGGSDDGAAYVGQFMPLFDDFGAVAARKVAQMVRVLWRSALLAAPSVVARFDYDMTFSAPPAGAQPSGDNLWGVGQWGVATWGGGGAKKAEDRWFSVGGSGDKISVAVQFTSGSVDPADVEIVQVDLSYIAGDIVT